MSPVPTFPPANVKKSRRIIVLAVVAIAATLLALTTTAVAAYEAGKAAGEAKQPAPAAPPAVVGSSAPVGSAPPDSSTPDAAAPAGAVTPTPNAVPSDINPSAQFTSAYQPQEQLQLRPGGQCTQLVDLDEPRVNVDGTVADLELRRCRDTATLGFTDGTSASAATNPNATPSECAESIRTSGLGAGAQVPVQPSTVLCVATSRSAALDKGITRKIAVLAVKAVAADGTVTFVVSAWNVPG